MRKLAYPLLALSLLAFNPAPAFAIDWLGIQTQSNIENNLRRHQQEGARQHNRKRPAETQSRSTRQGQSHVMSAHAERQARAEGQRIMNSHRPRLEREYNRRVARNGKALADRWLKREFFKIGERVGRQMRAKYTGR